MVYSQSQITDLRAKIIRKINVEIALAIKNDAIDELLELKGISKQEANRKIRDKIRKKFAPVFFFFVKSFV